jgi:hypothetical protein
MNKQYFINFLKMLAIPLLYALLLRFIFGVTTWKELFSVMSISFLFCLPTIMGILTLYFSSVEGAQKISNQIFLPWIPIFAFFIITLIIKIEGWACWIMVLPLFLFAASIGGFIGAYLKNRKKNNNLYVSAFALIPLLISPIEHIIGSFPGTYKAYTYIDINATAEKIWNNVTRVREISPAQDKGWFTQFMGFPRPVRAELNYNGVGASREAIFTNGLVFHETVSEYIEQKKMVFSIKANPYEIPSTTMDEHILIGGEYFDVLNGTYELEKLTEKTYRLHLYSHFKMTTTFNFYASLWGKWIMQDIQNNILQVEKQRAEAE